MSMIVLIYKTVWITVLCSLSHVRVQN